jgi:transcriptional regulator with XRE-family HTH domain
MSGLTQGELARLAGVAKGTVFDLERGKHSIQLDTLIKILSALNIQISYKSGSARDAEAGIEKPTGNKSRDSTNEKS